MNTLIIIKLISLVIAVWYSISIIGNLINKASISALILFIQAISLVTFLTIQFKLYQ